MLFASRKDFVARLVVTGSVVVRRALTLLPGLGVLAALASQGWFAPRTTLPAPPRTSPSPWWVAAAAAHDAGACQLSLRVHDAAAGSVVADARVALVRLRDGAVVERIEARTNARGAYRAIDLAPGTWNATVDVDGYALQGAPDFRCEGRGQRAFFDLAAARATHVVRGRVVGDARRPLPDATVALWQDDRRRDAVAGVVRVDVEADGRFRAALPPGEYVAYVTARDHVPKRATLRVGAPSTAWTARLTSQPTVRGVVVDEQGRPVAGAVVAMGDAWDPAARAARVVADDAGRFALPVVRGQELTVTARGDARVGRVALGVIDDVAVWQALTVTAVPGRTIRGVVFAFDGAPRPHGRVRYRVRALGLEGEVPCDGDGRFVLDGMPVEDVEAWAADNATGAWGARVADASTSELALPWTPPAY
ncbi:MAG: carboxypeptidase regulatory-like domain-containing protein [Deltaproteobacteria bacterium]|nr:carboxypeptidase regulatory-like domain-containing protein [Deltaproteobacteria bacterium]